MQIQRALAVIALLVLTPLMLTEANAEGILANATSDDQLSLPQLLNKAQGGDKTAMNNVGMRYQNGRGAPVDYAKAMDWYRKGYQAGSAAAAGNIGMLYQHGMGVKRDDAVAMKWYQTMWKMSYRDDTDNGKNIAGTAAANIGFLYDEGRGVKQDLNKAMDWYQKGVDLGNSSALNNMAYLLWDYGNQNQKNSAIEIWQEAARVGNPYAQDALRNRGYKW